LISQIGSEIEYYLFVIELEVQLQLLDLVVSVGALELEKLFVIPAERRVERLR